MRRVPAFSIKRRSRASHRAGSFSCARSTTLRRHGSFVDGTASENLLTLEPGPYKKGTQTVRDASVKRSRNRHLCKDSNRIMLPEGTPAWHDLLDIEVI